MHNDGVGISHEMLHFKSQEIAKRQGINHSQFKVSRGMLFYEEKMVTAQKANIVKPTNTKGF
jgi:hypothetical protein